MLRKLFWLSHIFVKVFLRMFRDTEIIAEPKLILLRIANLNCCATCEFTVERVISLG
ncbi:hypothetical protein GmarT_38630 [Gimesia maris]|uniref:HMA domain-containing protein n=1 Tax=Gimesia maris TaxID=122 RepID=A0ABX5YQV9_9PLAN|nr:hypothetical protein Mal35_37750 [Gimesia maris]QDU15951.1 hypothetical protein CA11_37790 [Gimesia maris]QEG17978.1 hypothetical protein GmarT_38630 [Gimesia maris]